MEDKKLAIATQSKSFHFDLPIDAGINHKI